MQTFVPSAPHRFPIRIFDFLFFGMILRRVSFPVSPMPSPSLYIVFRLSLRRPMSRRECFLPARLPAQLTHVPSLPLCVSCISSPPLIFIAHILLFRRARHAALPRFTHGYSSVLIRRLPNLICLVRSSIVSLSTGLIYDIRVSHKVEDGSTSSVFGFGVESGRSLLASGFLSIR